MLLTGRRIEQWLGRDAKTRTIRWLECVRTNDGAFVCTLYSAEDPCVAELADIYSFELSDAPVSSAGFATPADAIAFAVAQHSADASRFVGAGFV